MQHQTRNLPNRRAPGYVTRPLSGAPVWRFMARPNKATAPFSSQPVPARGGVRGQRRRACAVNRAFRTGVARIATIRSALVTGLMNVDAQHDSHSIARFQRARGDEITANAIVPFRHAFFCHHAVARFHRDASRRADVPVNAGPGGRAPSQPFDMAAPPPDRALQGPARRRPHGTGDPAPRAMSIRVSHGQQNAHRRIAPGRDPGGGAPR